MFERFMPTENLGFDTNGFQVMLAHLDPAALDDPHAPYMPVQLDRALARLGSNQNTPNNKSISWRLAYDLSRNLPFGSIAQAAYPAFIAISDSNEWVLQYMKTKRTDGHKLLTRFNESSGNNRISLTRTKFLRSGHVAGFAEEVVDDHYTGLILLDRFYEVGNFISYADFDGTMIQLLHAHGILPISAGGEPIIPED